jgi:hypothetical protein
MSLTPEDAPADDSFPARKKDAPVALGVRNGAGAGRGVRAMRRSSRRTGGEVIVGASPPGNWASISPLLERSISGVLVPNR